MNRLYVNAVAVALALLAGPLAFGDLIVRKDGSVVEGKITARDAKGLTVEVDGQKSLPSMLFPADTIARVVVIDEKGAAVAEADGIKSPAKRPDPKWEVPKEPAGPAVTPAPKGSSYYVIPLHGTVGQTILADSLEKSLADAAKRKPTVVILDIDSPGGLVNEAQLMMKTLHKYNKELRIVVLADQTLSAAAITSLSAREIYMKSSGTIGAATAFNASNPDAPKDISEKMQSAWRAAARNSAEEGDHDPLIAEAMIDSSKDLFIDTVAGKPVIKEGTGPKMLVTKGKILTLTSHEAVKCGLAVDIADDFAELGDEMKLKDWKECPGLGTVLADYLPTRWEAFTKKAQEIEAEFKENLKLAQNSAPSEEIITQRIVTGPTVGPTGPGARGGSIGPMGPTGPRGGAGARGGGGGAGGFGAGGGGGFVQPGIPQPAQPQRVVTQQIRTVSPEERAKWKDHSLATVVSLQKMEQNIRDEVSLAEAFGQKGNAEAIRDALSDLASVRSAIYADRNKYSGDSNPIVANPSRGPAPAAPSAPSGPAVKAPVIDGAAGAMPPLTAKNAPLDDAFAKAVKEAVDKKNYKAGQTFGGGFAREQFEDISTDGGILIGLRCGLGKFGNNADIIASVQPVYLTAKGIVLGQLHGNPAAKPVVDMVARDGYVVGGAKLGGGANLDAVALTFVRFANGKLDPSDSYETQRIGNTDPYTVVSDTMPVVGITGKTNNTGSLALGLVFMNDPNAKPAAPARRGPAPPTARGPAAKDGLPDGAVKSEQLGGSGGSPYVRVDDRGRLMIGVKFSMGHWSHPVVGHIEPLFEKPADNADKDSTIVIAKDGYVVGGMHATASDGLEAFQIHFMRLKDGKPNPSDQYDSDWYGAPGDHANSKVLANNGDKVIGIYGRQGMNNDAMGLIVMPDKAAAPK